MSIRSHLNLPQRPSVAADGVNTSDLLRGRRVQGYVSRYGSAGAHARRPRYLREPARSLFRIG